MSLLGRIRRWVNRDDGKLLQVGNTNLGWAEIVGMLLATGGLLLWQLHAEIGLSWIWVAASGALGLCLSILGGCSKPDSPGH